MLPKFMTNVEQKNIIIKNLFKGMRFCQVKTQSLVCEISASIRKLGYNDKRFEELRKLKNQYSGKRCFIIATGPSLTVEDLELLSNEYTFGMNSICQVYEKTNWRPTFFGIQDIKVYDILKDKITADSVNFIPYRLAQKKGTPPNAIVFPSNSYYHDFELRYDIKLFSKFSSNCYATVYDGYSITFSLLQIAVYLGFSDIYLLGADCNYVAGQKQHFIEHGHNDPKFLTAGERNIVSYMAAKAYADHHGIKIYNATRGGMLEVFERKQLEEIIG